MSRARARHAVNPDLLLPATPAPADHTTGTLPASLISQRERAGFLRPGIPSLTASPKNGYCWQAGDALDAPGRDAQPAGAGLVSLRQAIARYLNISRGLSCTAEQVLITSGYSGSLRLILDTLASRSDKVVFEDPGYFMGQQLLKRIVPRLTPCRSIAAASTRSTCCTIIATPVCYRDALSPEPTGGNALSAA